MDRVLKFGGTSVASRARWSTIADQVRATIAEGVRPIVVCSAVAGASDALLAVIEAALAGRAEVGAVRARHAELAAELDIDLALVEDDLVAIERAALGISLLGEASPRVRADLLARGELMSTRLGAAFLAGAGLPVRWVDARELLHAPTPTEPRGWLHAPCVPAADLAERLPRDEAVITQGFIARAGASGTALLGRGGSDTSAALLAAALRADRCEIWTDVPGMFTGDPNRIPGARLLRAVGYAEAQEIATTGAKVLHPAAIPPVREAGVPLTIRCTPNPSLPSTRIAADVGEGPPSVKAISWRRDLVLVSMETLGMWQQVGFLARAFGVFAACGLSVDNVSTSETSVTVTLDPLANPLDADSLARLLEALRPLCTPHLVTGCASVSLVGRGIRGILHRLAPVLELFEHQRVHLLTQAASDLNLTVVVDERDAARLVDRLHAELFAHRGPDEVLGPTWQELAALRAPARPRPGPGRDVPWWHHRREALLALAETTPLYVVDETTLRGRAQALRGLRSPARLLYAMKANPSPGVLDVVVDEGIDLECVSPGELALAEARVEVRRILFTPNFAPRAEVAAALTRGLTTTLDDTYPLERWAELFAGRDLLVRVDPGRGRGHHAKVRTAGERSKFGIAAAKAGRLRELADAAGARVIGLHAHAGSGVLDPKAWSDTAATLLGLRDAHFPEAGVIDLGGGLGVPDRPGAQGLDLGALDAALAPFREAADLWLEPGRYFVAEAGVLLTRVTQVKRKGDRTWVGVDAGMNTLIRPALYGAWHPVANLTRLGERPAGQVTVVGPICESGDVLARDRSLPPTEEGDVLLVGFAGAYGSAMQSTYNHRGPAPEVLLPR